MAYLTKYNLGQLARTLHIKCEVTLDLFLANICADEEIFPMLNKIEIEYLFKYKMLLADEKVFVNEYYREVPEKEDTKDFVFNKGGRTKYHMSQECKLLTNDYLDFNIPEEIKQQDGVDAVAEYRTWFTDHNFKEKYMLGIIDIDAIIFAFNSRYPAKYGIPPLESNSSILVTKKPNSKFDEVSEVFDAELARAQLDDLKKQWNFHFPCGVTKVIAKFKHLLNKSDQDIERKITELFSAEFISNYGMDNLKNKFHLSKVITSQIVRIILEQIKWTFKQKEKCFDKRTLEHFGLKCCLNCKSQEANPLPK